MSTSMAASGAAASWTPDEALEQLYAAHHRSLVRLGVLLLGDRELAEEVVQDSFVAVHAHWGKLSDPHHGLAYLRRTVVNRAHSAQRRRGVEQRHLRTVLPARDLPGADHALAQSERRRQVLAALSQLPRRQREVLVLRHYLDLDEAGVAEALGISRGAVKSHAHRGAARLRGLLEEERHESA